MLNPCKKLLAFLRRDLLIAASYRVAWGLDLTEILLTVAAFFFLSRLVGPGPSSLLAPYSDYFSFVLIGVAAFNYFFVSLNQFAQTLRESQLNGTLEALLVTRTSAFGLFVYTYLAILLAQWVRWVFYFLVAALAFGLSLARADWPAALFLLGLGLALFLGFGLVSASFILAFKKGDPFNWLLAALSWLLSGTLFPVEVLPGWLQSLSQLFPVTPLLAGLRKALLLGVGVVELHTEAIRVAGFAVLLLAGGSVFSRWALQRARREGSLGHY